MRDFLNVVREPDSILIQTENSPFRFEEGETNRVDAKVSCVVDNNALQIILEPTKEAVKWIKLRFRGDFSSVRTVFEDAFERGMNTNLCWYTPKPERLMPWYFFAGDGSTMDAYGVKTGPNAFAFWQCDRSGITLWLDVRNGSSGFSPKEPLVCAEVICRRGLENEKPYFAAQQFCKMMCDAPNLPKEPVFGFNNWYWAYGITSQEEVVQEAKFLSGLCKETEYRPYMIMDDGWQINASSSCYNGGPWRLSNPRFPDMQKMAEDIVAAGCKPGLWFRPLATLEIVPPEATYKSPYAKNAIALDPSHPFTLEKVANDVSRFVSWGYKLIKHDFTSMDLFTEYGETGEAQMYDKGKTNAQIIKNLYWQIQKSAKESIVIGCNTINHLTAGIHQLQRVGADTSGRAFEWTRQFGIHSMMRMIQNEAFFKVDPDCAAFTKMVPADLNLDFMEAMAISGASVLASVTPGILTSQQEQRMSDIFSMASSIKPQQYAAIEDWDRTTVPSEFSFGGETRIYDWYRAYDGARTMLDWMH